MSQEAKTRNRDLPSHAQQGLLLTRRSLLITLLASTPHGAAAQDIRNTEIAHPKTHFTLRRYSSRREWERRRRQLRRQILGAAGLLPYPERTPVRAEVVRRTRHDDYCTEAILLETLPGYWVGGTVYRPIDSTERWPGVLVPHGHWKRGRVEHLPSYSVPALGINLALQGYVALAWDMVGYNDSRQTPHDFGGWREQLWGFNPLGLQLWNSTRVLDYLSSRPDVDSRRIGCTGASGGATQTILLTATDDRITCSAPVNMISASYQGADPCEEAPNLRLGTNNVEIAAMAAPRPMLMVSCTGDWTRNTPTVEYPAVRSIYQLFDRTDLVQNAHFEAEHNYDRRTRERVYTFLAKHLQGTQDYQAADKEVGNLNVNELLAHTPETPIGSETLKYEELFEQWMSASRAQREEATGPNVMKHALHAALGCEWPRRVGASDLGERLVLTRAGKKDRVPAVWMRGKGTPAVLVHQDGLDGARNSPELKKLRAAGRPVLAVEVFQTGSGRPQRQSGGRWYLSYNQTDDANRVQDILTALSWLRSQTKEEPEVVGLGRAALWVVFAAAVSPYNASVVADLSKYTGSDEEMKDQFFVPCVQRAGGLSAARQLVKKLRSSLEV